MEVFEELIRYESNNIKKFEINPKVSKIFHSLKLQANKILKGKLLVPDGLNQYTYRQQNGQIAKINSINQTCSCAIFLDKATCKHLIAYKLNIDGYPIFPKKLLTLRQRKRKQYLDASIEATNQVVDDQVEGDR